MHAPTLAHGLTQLRITVFRGGDRVGTESFSERHLVLGRDPTMADLVISSSKVSREHALVEHDGQRIFVHDLNSTNGIYLNGLRIDRAEVHPGDDLAVGEHTLRLELQHGRSGRSLPPTLPGAAAPETAAAKPDEAPFFAPASEPPAAPAVLGALASTGRLTLRVDDVAALIDDWDERAAEQAAALAPVPWAELLLQEPSTVTAETSPRRLRLAVLTTQGDLLVEHRLLRPGQARRLGPGAMRQRFGRPARLDEGMRVRLGRNGLCQVILPGRSTWHLQRALGTWDETVGIREGWATRRRDGIHIRLQAPEILACSVGSRTYSLRFVPRPPRPPAAPLWRQGHRRRWGLWLLASLSLNLLALNLLGHALWRHRQTIPAVAVQWQMAPTAVPARAYGGRGRPPPELGARLPPAELAPPVGGAQGPPFLTYGALAAGPTYDPQQPAAGPEVTLKRAAAFLRGNGTSLTALLPPAPGGGPSWRLHLSAADLVLSRSDGPTETQLLPILERAAPALAQCYARYLPADAGLSGRIELHWQLDGRGRPVDVQPSGLGAPPDLVACMRQVLTPLRFPAPRGPGALGLNAVLGFRRIGFD